MDYPGPDEDWPRWRWRAFTREESLDPDNPYFRLLAGPNPGRGKLAGAGLVFGGFSLLFFCFYPVDGFDIGRSFVSTCFFFPILCAFFVVPAMGFALRRRLLEDPALPELYRTRLETRDALRALHGRILLDLPIFACMSVFAGIVVLGALAQHITNPSALVCFGAMAAACGINWMAGAYLREGLFALPGARKWVVFALMPIGFFFRWLAYSPGLGGGRYAGPVPPTPEPAAGLIIASLELFLAFCRVNGAQTAWSEAEKSFAPLLEKAARE